MRRRLGARGHYALATVKTLSRFVPAMFHVELDGSSLDVDAMLVVVGNSFAYGGGHEGAAAGVDRRRRARRLHRLRHEQGGVPPRVPEGVRRGSTATHPNVTMLKRHATSRSRRTGAMLGVRGRGAGRLAPGRVHGAAEGAPGRGRSQREGDPMTDGVLLIHAFPLDARMWEPQLAAFGDGVAVVAPHLPGFGGTPAAGDVMTMGCGRRAVHRGAGRRGCGPRRGLRSLDGRVRGVRAVAARPASGSRACVLANTRAGADTRGGRGRTPRAGRSGCWRKGNGFLVESPPPLLSERCERRSPCAGSGS